MSDENHFPPTSPDLNTTRPRRASFAAGQSLADLFRSAPRAPPNPSGTSAYPGPRTNAAAQVQSRRPSVTTVGLSASPTQTSPFGSLRSRRGSISSGHSIDESAVEDPVGGDSAHTSSPNTPFARRMSFGARALMDRQSNAGQGANGRASLDHVTPSNSKNPSSPPAASARGRGLSLLHLFLRFILTCIPSLHFSTHFFESRLSLV